MAAWPSISFDTSDNVLMFIAFHLFGRADVWRHLFELLTCPNDWIKDIATQYRGFGDPSQCKITWFILKKQQIQKHIYVPSLKCNFRVPILSNTSRNVQLRLGKMLNPFNILKPITTPCLDRCRHVAGSETTPPICRVICASDHALNRNLIAAKGRQDKSC